MRTIRCRGRLGEGGCLPQVPEDVHPLGRHPSEQTPWADTPWANTSQQTPPGQTPPYADIPLGRHPPDQCMLGYTFPCLVHDGIHTPPCLVLTGIHPLSPPPPPPGTEFLTHACENINFPYLRLRAVMKSHKKYST